MLEIEYIDSQTKMPFYKVSDAESGLFLGWYERERLADEYGFVPSAMTVFSYSSERLREICDGLDKVNGKEKNG